MLTHDVSHVVSRTQFANIVGQVLQRMGNDFLPAHNRCEALNERNVPLLEILLLASRLQVSG